MQPYSPGKPIDEVKRELGLTEVVKLASNENPLGPSPKAIAAIQAAASQMHIYPDASAFAVTQAISKAFGIASEHIMLGNGSDELIHMLGQILLSQGDEMIVGDPSFVRYDAAAFLSGTKLIKVPVDADLRLDLEAMLAAVTDRTKIIWIANPNNPTGTIARRAQFEHLLDRLPSSIVVVLDEAYYDFAVDEPDYPCSLDYIKAGRVNVVGLRTFSKAYGLAGIRLGFGFAPAAIVDAFHRAREPFNCNSLAQVAAVAALGDTEHLERTIAVNREGRERLESALRELGARPVESFANFVVADMGQEAHPIFEALLTKGVIVRSGKGLGLPNHLRISVGTPDEMTTLISALRAILASPVKN